MYYDFKDCDQVPIREVLSMLGSEVTDHYGRENLICPNPEHDDQHPGSVRVYDNNNVIHCFACGYHAGPLIVVADHLGEPGIEGLKKAANWIGKNFGLEKKKGSFSPLGEREHFLKEADAILLGFAKKNPKTGRAIDVIAAPLVETHEWVDEEDARKFVLSDEDKMPWELYDECKIHTVTVKNKRWAPLRDLWVNNREMYYYIVALTANRVAKDILDEYKGLKKENPYLSTRLFEHYYSLLERLQKIFYDSKELHKKYRILNETVAC